MCRCKLTNEGCNINCPCAKPMMSGICNRCYEKSKLILARILVDLTDRKGFDNCWFQTDEEIKEEIQETWCRLIYQEITQ